MTTPRSSQENSDDDAFETSVHCMSLLTLMQGDLLSGRIEGNPLLLCLLTRISPGNSHAQPFLSTLDTLLCAIGHCGSGVLETASLQHHRPNRHVLSGSLAL